MIYAEIKYVEDDKKWKGFMLSFHWNESIEEADLWNKEIQSYYDNELQRNINFDGNYLIYKSIILSHLANRKFIPWWDNVFYKKRFFE